MARCCSPVPGEKICAYITKNRGAIVHRESCPISKEIKINFPERLVSAIWENEKETKFLLSVKISAQDRLGLIKDTTSTITNAGVNIFGIKGDPPKDGIASVSVKVEVLNIEEAEKVFLALKSVRGIIEIKRE
jgi:GTP pyrophosphokinase